MIASIRGLVSKERDLKMIWEVFKGGRRSYLVGASHFFPYHFRGSLRRYIGRVETVVFEGPLDQESARTVVAYGSQRGSCASLVDALPPSAIARITGEFGEPWQSLSSHLLYRRVLDPHWEELDWEQMRHLKPWMAFFRIWSHFLRKGGWTYTMELDALRIAGELGRDVQFLETIEEQLQALDDIPLEQMVRFLTNVDWRETREEILRSYLSGNLEGLLRRAHEFPTFCESIVEKRDPILYRRMKPFFENGNVLAFVGTTHCHRIKALFIADGYQVCSPLPGASPREERAGARRR